MASKTSKQNPAGASALIAAANSRDVGIVFTEPVRAELAEIMAHNDTAPRSRRVSGEAVMRMLAEVHGMRIGRTGFDAAVYRSFGRTWGGK